ncbi:MAG: helix-turn-helix transcriptional regulator [Clostridia bacterium]|nr:helix-turn-helix transcriptional regulator [Clostridia bacterium]
MEEKKVKFEFYNEKLLEYRKNKNLSQEEIAEKIGVSRQSIYAWESGKSVPDIENMSKLCQVLDITANDLTNGLKYSSTENENLKDVNKRINKKTIKRIILILLLIIIIVYLITSIRKFIILTDIHLKIKNVSYYNNYSYDEYSGKEDNGVNSVNVINSKRKEIKYKDNVMKIKETAFNKNENFETNYTWININTKEGYYYNMEAKTYSKIEDVNRARGTNDTSVIKRAALENMIDYSTLGKIVNAFNPFFYIENSGDFYCLEYEMNMPAYEVKVQDYKWKENGFPYGIWRYNQDGSNSFVTYNIEVGNVTDEEVAKPDFTGYTLIETNTEETE